MVNLSPKIEIINHFDNLVNKVDIDIEDSIEKYNDEKVLGELLLTESSIYQKYELSNFKLEFHGTVNSLGKNEYQTVNLWCESTKVIDYLNEVRKRTIEELRNEQEESLETYKLHSSQLRSELKEVKSIDELKSKLFSDKFYFQVQFTQSEKRLWAFNIYTFVTDFYMSPTDINLLEKLINVEKEPFCFSQFNSPAFDEKMVLIGLLYNKFIENMLNFPNHLIDVRKQDVSNVKAIYYRHHCSEVNLTTSTIDLTKLEQLALFLTDRSESAKIDIEGLSSLKNLYLGVSSNEINISTRNLTSLTYFGLFFPNTIDENFTTKLCDQLPNIEQLSLSGDLSYFNLDDFVNLKSLVLKGVINDDFNFQLFKNLCNQLEQLSILSYIENETLFKLIDGHCFPNLVKLEYEYCNIRILNKSYFNQFPMLRELSMNNCKLKLIEDDAFSNLRHLVRLDLRENSLQTLDKQIFIQLINLEQLNLSKNRLEYIEKDIFSNLKNLKTLDLSENRLELYPESFIGLQNSVEIRL